MDLSPTEPPRPGAGRAAAANLDESGFSPLNSDETVLSDIHVFADDKDKTDSQTVISRFVFKEPAAASKSPLMVDKPSEFCLEDDEDLDVECQRKSSSFEVLRMEHQMATVLNDVGAQIWKGALYLADFILARPEHFRDRVVLELGAGVGLASIVCGYTGSRTVFCTDALPSALDLSQKNLTRNSSLFLLGFEDVRIRYLDWFKPFDFSGDGDGRFGWKNDDFEVLNSGFTVIAADVIYSDELTDAFFATVLNLCTKFKKPFDVWLSIEKRLNFTLDELEVCSPPYRHFQQCLRKHSVSTIAKLPCITPERISDDFPRAFDYERSPELELWKLHVDFSAE